LARETGESITVAAKIAIEERLTRVRRQREVAMSRDLTAIIHRGRARPMLDDRSNDEILGYDDSGLPS
jgi:antitoxin VapB